jgi:uncharacterized membrane protein YedE/YeeE
MSRPAPPRKWGIRTLLFLGLAAASIILSNWMRMTGNTDVILLTFIGLLVGLIGATVSTIQGIRVWGGRLPGEEPPPDRRQRP